MICLQNRTIKVTFRVNEAEQAHLKEQAAKAGLPVEPFLRRLVMGVELRPRPPEGLTEILRQLSAIGNNTNQIARIANATGHIRAEDIEAVKAMQLQIWRLIKAL